MPHRLLQIEATTHGRVLVVDAADPSSERLLVAFHGYAQRADDILDEVRQIPGIHRWSVAALQALHQFYLRDNRTVVACWMTRQDREAAIADNVAYVDRALAPMAKATLVFAGFSQGASMAYRAAALGQHRASGVIALGGDIPPELKTADCGHWPPVLIGAGDRDEWYTPVKVEADLAFLRSQSVPHEVVRFRGGHEWADEFRRAAGAWLANRL